MQSANNNLVKACILMSVFLMLAWNASARAEDALRFGVTGLKYNGEFNDNIFRDADDGEN